ncbi:MAG: carbohydrate deacetylase [Chthoniobacterales bacterium]
MAKDPRAKWLIVNADDFGLTSGVNRGIIEAREHGIVTSASLMVRGSAAGEAATYARRNPPFSVGLHFDAAEWRYEGGEWALAYQVVDSADADAVRDELDRQLAEFVKLMGRTPTHLDSHQHMHLNEPARAILTEAAAQLNVPLRSCAPDLRYRGDFYGQTTEGEPYAHGISVEHLVQMIAELPAGWTEFGTHPGYAAGVDSVYASEREDEVRALCSHEVHGAITAEGVKLCSFHDLRS